MAPAAISATKPIEELAQYCAGLSWQGQSKDVQAKTLDCVLDTMGALLAGTVSREYRQISSVLEQGTALTLPGMSAPVTMRDAAQALGTAAHAFELDDAGGCDHSGAVVIPALLAALANTHVDGARFLESVLVGYEVGRRVLEAAGGYGPHNGRGWHSTGTCGAIGAAAAVAHLWGYDAMQTQHAMTIATSFSSGLWAFIHDGSQTKKLHTGRAAEGGLFAAGLARAGFKGPSLVFDDVWGGFFRSFNGDAGAPELLSSDLGERPRILRISVKPYASCRGTHTAIDALRLILVEKDGATEVQHILVRMSPFQYGMCGGRDLSSLAATQMSLPYALAADLVLNRADLLAYAEDHRHSRAIADRLTQIETRPDDCIGQMEEPIIEVTFTDGCTLSKQVERATGSAEVPLSEHALRAKALTLAELVMAPQAASALIDWLRNLSEAPALATDMFWQGFDVVRSEQSGEAF